MKRVILVGGGLGGLSCAIRLAHAGYAVTIYEKEAELGGKLKREVLGQNRFDVGPSTLTMISAFERVFQSVGRKIEDYLEFYSIDPLTRNVFWDGSIVDLTKDVDGMAEQIATFSPHDALNYKHFLQESKNLYNLAETRFLNRLLVNWRDKLSPSLLRDFIRVRPFTTLDRFLKKYFTHPNTLAMFGRYATYVGASPYQAPAIYAMMAHLESQLGIYGIKGGTYTLVEAFERLARELGVQIHTASPVSKLVVKNKTVQGVDVQGRVEQADHVVVNLDYLSALSLIEEDDRPSMPDANLLKIEPSLSGFVVLASVQKRFDTLRHHTVFFPEQYRHEFESIFKQNTPPTDPTIYICNSGYSDLEGTAPGESHLFILVNAPALSDHWSWCNKEEDYAEAILQKLETRGLATLTESVTARKIYTPETWQSRTGAYKGAIYGLSSNGIKQAFFRPSNRLKDLSSLWFVGGSTHPGGGTPIVTIGGQLVAEAIMNV